MPTLGAGTNPGPATGSTPRVGQQAFEAPRAHRPRGVPAGSSCGPRPPRSSERRGRRSCGCGRCRRAGLVPTASPARRRPVRRPRAVAGPTAGPVGGEPTGAEQLLVVVNDLDGRRQFVGIDPDDHACHDAFLALNCRWERRGGQCYYEQGSPLLSHASSRCPAGRRPKESHTRPSGGQPHGEPPAEHLARVWPDTGPTGIVQ